MPEVEFDLVTKEYKYSEEYDQHINLLRAKIGKQLTGFSNRFSGELGVSLDKACFNIAGVGSLPVTKNYKYDSFTWRGIIEMKKEAPNIGLTDYILGGVSMSGKSNVFIKPQKPDNEDKLVAGKLREHPLVKFMLQALPPG
jgi:hypothetical protein